MKNLNLKFVITFTDFTDIGRRMRNFCLHLQYRIIPHSPADVCIFKLLFYIFVNVTLSCKLLVNLV